MKLDTLSNIRTDRQPVLIPAVIDPTNLYDHSDQVWAKITLLRDSVHTQQISQCIRIVPESWELLCQGTRDNGTKVVKFEKAGALSKKQVIMIPGMICYDKADVMDPYVEAFYAYGDPYHTTVDYNYLECLHADMDTLMLVPEIRYFCDSNLLHLCLDAFNIIEEKYKALLQEL